ncbi:hypothetical protein NIES2111_61990 (plasmid) [Nostoc sp. NIES-2111]|nr:hypothetical protein NIES2111_61990 [Nostoc sp. NIES-2111]
MSLKRKKGFRIETKTQTSQLIRVGFDLSETNNRFSEVAMFFLSVVTSDPGGVDETDFKRYYEPKFFGQEANQVFPFDCPSEFRRAALAKAVGIYRSWRSKYQNWLSSEKKHKLKKSSKQLKHHKPPILPKSLKLNATFYKKMFKNDTGSTVVLKILVNNVWKWVKFHYSSAPNPGSEWVKSSPSLVLKQGKAFLNWTVERYQKATGGIKTLMQNEHRICSVDTDLDGELMKAVILDVDDDGSVRELARMTTTKHANHIHRRKSRLGKIAVAMKRTGIIAKGFAKQRWEKINRCEVDAGNQLSAQIVDFANRWGCAIIVFEALKRLTPCKGKYSRRSNQKRAYWLKSRVMKEVTRKARQNHNILTSHVNPKNTSRLCAYDQSEVWRGDTYNPSLRQMLEPYRYGGMCFVSMTGFRGNAGYNAARNIGLKFLARFYKSPTLVRVGSDKIASKGSG